jgi:heavy metal sensor kinase
MVTKTFRLRLTLIYTIVVVLIFIVSGIVIHVQFKNKRHESVDKELLREATTEFSHNVDPARIKNNEEIIKRVGDEYFQIINRGGEVRISSLNNDSLWPVNKEVLQKAFHSGPQFDTVSYKGENYRILYMALNEDNILSIGDSLKDVEEEVAALSRLSIIFFPFILVITSVTSWFLAGRALSPMVQIKSLAEEIRHGRLDRRIDVGVKGKEVDDLVRIFNEMVDSIQHSMEAQKRFTSDVSHEIRSPLTSLRGSIEVSLRKQRSTEEYEELLRNNLSDIIRLSRIAEDLLFLAKADNNILEIKKNRFDVNQMLKNIIERLKYDGLSIVEKYEEDLELYGDSGILEQAFTNLINNAIKYTPRGGTVTIMTEKGSDFVKVTIRDSGIGIPEDEIPYIFERFYRVDKERSRKMGGTGLGLAITQWIVHAHRGQILVKSKPGSGSDFIVVLPRMQTQAA